MDICVARQPILDKKRNLHAYELLYRSADPPTDNRPLAGDRATATVVVNSFLEIGLANLTGTRSCYINVNREILLSDAVTALPPERVVLEVLEDVPPDADVVAACRRLKDAGYTLALDDVIDDERGRQELLELVDVVKVDLMLAKPRWKWQLPTALKRRGLKFVAEKVETKEEFERCLEAGYDWFQGYFFCKPELVRSKTVPGFRLNYLRLLKELSAPDVDFDATEAVIKSDTALSYQLLKLINSAAFIQRRQISDVHNALVTLGVRETRKWASMLCLSDMARDRPGEIIVQSLVRAQFCEALSRPIQQPTRATELFLMGLLSLIDAIVERPMAEIIADLNLAEDVTSALVQRSGPFGCVLDLVGSFEQGDWTLLGEITAAMGVPGPQVLPLYLTAVRRADEVYGRG
ncbi:MAG: HDOD domain-containing protein [Armatimonadetes bacterium]|nr:HDOD domain-containing protein [Armatimonadota bacterium]